MTVVQSTDVRKTISMYPSVYFPLIVFLWILAYICQFELFQIFSEATKETRPQGKAGFWSLTTSHLAIHHLCQKSLGYEWLNAEMQRLGSGTRLRDSPNVIFCRAGWLRLLILPLIPFQADLLCTHSKQDWGQPPDPRLRAAQLATSVRLLVPAGVGLCTVVLNRTSPKKYKRKTIFSACSCLSAFTAGILCCSWSSPGAPRPLGCDLVSKQALSGQPSIEAASFNVCMVLSVFTSLSYRYHKVSIIPPPHSAPTRGLGMSELNQKF